MVVPGSIRLVPTPFHNDEAGQFGRSIALAPGPFTNRSQSSTPLLLVGAPGMRANDPSNHANADGEPYGAAYVFELSTVSHWHRVNTSDSNGFPGLRLPQIPAVQLKKAPRRTAPSVRPGRSHLKALAGQYGNQRSLTAIDAVGAV